VARFTGAGGCGLWGSGAGPLGPFGAGSGFSWADTAGAASSVTAQQTTSANAACHLSPPMLLTSLPWLSPKRAV
jgi:hypothetical protein